ncbi:MAG: hypothetical protein LUQ25_06515 [Methanoregulaceae archaeon]|nr:hypothetical protein [Methanoregulaceae archaeon]
MEDPIVVEIVGLEMTECSPFPCDEERSCGLTECRPTGRLVAAVPALNDILYTLYGNRVAVKLTLIDHGIPAHVREILESHEYPLPIVIINGKPTKIGRVALDRIKKEIEACH